MAVVQGIAFPFRISSASGGVQIAQASDIPVPNDLIWQSIYQIIMTRIGERDIEKDFGTDVVPSLFEPLDTIFQATLQYSIVKALALWEPRIQVQNVQFDQSQLAQGKIGVLVTYTNTRSGITQSVQVTSG